MTREEMLKWLEQIEKDIYVCSLESTFADDAKSCAIHEAIQALSAEPCEDAISRQAVITIIKELCNPYGKPQIDFEVGKKMIEWFKAIPSVQPVRPKGEWIVDNDAFSEMNGYILECHCSGCHHEEEFYDHKSWTTPTLKNANVYNYCPNCGADMRTNNLKYADQDTMQGGLMSAT